MSLASKNGLLENEFTNSRFKGEHKYDCVILVRLRADRFLVHALLVLVVVHLSIVVLFLNQLFVLDRLDSTCGSSRGPPECCCIKFESALHRCPPR